MSDLLDAKSFRKMQEAYRNTQELREETIKLSRDIQKESKQAIYAIHRKDLASSREKIGKAEKTIGQIRKLICDTPALESVGSYSESLEEYVEASALLAFMENRGIPTPEKLGVGNEIYLQGLCDLSGELEIGRAHV
jgi:translin